jgi:hypothetical protein
MIGNWFEKTPSHLEQMTKRHENIYLVGGFNPSEKYEVVSWDDDIPNIWKNKSHVPNHQPENYVCHKSR